MARLVPITFDMPFKLLDPFVNRSEPMNMTTFVDKDPSVSSDTVFMYLARNPNVSHLTTLIVDGNKHVNAHALAEVAKSPYLKNITSLSVPNVGDDELCILSACTNFKLKKLTLRGCDVSMQRFKTFVNSTNMSSLTHLDLTNGYCLKDEGFNILLDSPLVNNLEKLDITCIYVSKIIITRPLPKLKQLHANNYNLVQFNVKNNLINLEDLQLGIEDTKFGKKIFKNNSFPNLCELVLDESSVDYGTFKAIVENITASRLQYLSINHNEEFDDKCCQLMTSSHFKNLTRLDINESSSVTIEGIRIISNTVFWTKLIELQLGDVVLGEEGAKLVSHCRFLRKFMGSRCKVGVNGTKYLAQLFYLEYLDLNEGEIGDEGCKIIAESPSMSHLKYLDVGGNGVTAIGCKYIASSPHLCLLENLYLCGNEIGDVGVDALANSEQMNLLLLDVSNNGITINGIKMIVDSNSLEGLEEIDISDNDIEGEKGEEMLFLHMPYLKRNSTW